MQQRLTRLEDLYAISKLRFVKTQSGEGIYIKKKAYIQKTDKKTMQKETIQSSGYIRHDPERCTGCGACELACSLYHESAENPTLSRISLNKDDFNGNFSVDVCIQCYQPGCFFACPVKAVKIDDIIGVRYISELCIGCGKCTKACPLMPSKQVIKSKNVNGRRKYFKCDLCNGRSEGPICVELCPACALTYIKSSERF